MHKVLLIDNSQQDARHFRSIMESEGLAVEWCDSSAQAAITISSGEQEFVAIFISMEMPGSPFPLELLLLYKENLPDVPVIAISGALNAMIAVRASSLGAHDIFEKPLDSERVRSCMRSLMAKQDSSSPVVEELNKSILGQSPALFSMLRQVAKVVNKTKLRVLLIGESGTGKELVAQAIHKLGPKGIKPCVAVNVGAIPADLIESQFFGHEKGAFTGADQPHDGYLQQAGDGTLFLDEIGDLDLSLQGKLLRVIQEKTFRRLKGTMELPFKARLVCATNQDLAAAVNQGTFRRDLFHRIAGVTIQVPPLRERKGDLDLLLNYFLELYGENRPVRFARESLTTLRSYPFPGNIRELENVVSAALAICEDDLILPKHLQLEIRNVFIQPEAQNLSSTAGAAAPGQKAQDEIAQARDLTAAPSPVYQDLFDRLAHVLPENWLDLPHKEMLEQHERAFDWAYLSRLMELHFHKVSKATKAAGIDRKTFERRWKRAGLPPRRAEDKSDE